MLNIDGSQGEGGGQILRTALALSMCLGRPFRIHNIRANRRRPGLQHQHLAAVKAAAIIAQANVEGANKDSRILVFKPGPITAGHFQFDIGTAGSTSLVLQTILPALMLASASSTLVLEGGTHNPMAPTFEFLLYAFLPLVNQMGPNVVASLHRRGFAPQGGGRLHVSIKPSAQLQSFDLRQRGDIIQRRAEVILANLPSHIAQRELVVICNRLSLTDECLHSIVDNNAQGVGNVVSIIIESTNVTECFTAFGKKGLPAERVAEQVVNMAQTYLNAGVPIGTYLADQLLLLMALSGNSRFITMQPSSHTLTNLAVIEIFMGRAITAQQIDDDRWEIYCKG